MLVILKLYISRNKILDVKAETAVTELLRKILVFLKEVQMFKF